MVSMGAIASTARVAVDELRREGFKVGLFRPRLFRPTPMEEWRNKLINAKAIAVVDRAISFGGPGGPLFLDVAASMINDREKPLIKSYVAGIGGRDVTVKDLKTILKNALKIAERGEVDELCSFIGVR